jgi:Raf kinase inhibitor-like YbhB/YbcL family protein
MRRARLILATLSSVAAAVSASSASAQAGWSDPGLQAAGGLQVQVAGVAPEGELPLKFTREGHNLSPAISWTAVPGARGYVVAMEDAEAAPGASDVHWIVYDLPAGVQALPGSIRNVDALDKPLGAAQGANNHGSLGYTGPTAAGQTAPHAYRYEVWALSRPLRVKPGARPERVFAAMRGKVIARGDLLVHYPAGNARASGETTGDGR